MNSPYQAPNPKGSSLPGAFPSSISILPEMQAFLRSPLECFFQYEMLGNHQDGGSSRVYCFHPEVADKLVLKLTSCEATQELLKRAWTEQYLRKKVQGLPEVSQTLGMCARDDDAIEYHGFVLERLRRAQTQSEAEREQQLVRAVRSAMHEATGETGEALHWSTSLVAANRLAQSDLFGLGPAFEIVSRVILTTSAYLDLDVPGNILFTLEGEICLADPVAMTCSIH